MFNLASIKPSYESIRNAAKRTYELLDVCTDYTDQIVVYVDNINSGLHVDRQSINTPRPRVTNNLVQVMKVDNNYVESGVRLSDLAYDEFDAWFLNELTPAIARLNERLASAIYPTDAQFDRVVNAWLETAVNNPTSDELAGVYLYENGDLKMDACGLESDSFMEIARVKCSGENLLAPYATADNVNRDLLKCDMLEYLETAVVRYNLFD